MVKYYLTFIVFTCFILNSYSNAQCALVEVNVRGNSTTIADGSLNPSLSNHSDFGYVPACSGSIVRTFTIENTGTNSLNLTNPILSGADAAEFSITLNPSATVAASGSTSFQVTFDPSTSGTKSATITFTNDDCDEATYDFAVEGRGIASPTATCVTNTINVGDYGTGIVNFIFNTINNTHSDFMNDGTQDFTCSNYTTVLPGSTYTFTVNLYGTLGFGSNDEYAEIYIDYDDDGTFSAGELVYSNMSTRQMVHTGNITIPTSGAVTGKLLRLRVKTDYPTFNDACSDSQYGEIEDYAIYIDCYTPTITSSTPGSICGTGTVDLAATASAGSLSWYDAASGGTLLGTGTTFTTPSISTSTDYYVEATDNSCTSATRTLVTATTGTCTQLRPGYCGTTLSTFNQYLCCDAVTGATAYRFQITDGTNTYYYTSGTVGIRLNLVPGIKYGTTYSIKAAAQVGGVWLGYGTPCTITTPLTVVQPWYCGVTNSNITDYMACYPVEGATQYKFEITDGTNTYTYTSNGTGFRFSNFPSVKYNTTYAVRVAAKVGGSFSAYGAPCNITTPLTKMQTWYCGITVSPMSQYLACYSVNGATQYRFKLFDGTNTLYFTSNSIGFRLSLVPGIQTNTTYAVSVAANVGGSWSAYGTACSITSAETISAMQQDDEILVEAPNDLMEDISVEAYPNPNTGNFVITSTHDGELQLTNELGQVLQTISLNDGNKREMNIEELGTGVYFITGSINGNTITKKVMVL